MARTHERSEAGLSNMGMILGMAGLLAVLLIVAIVVSLTLPSTSTTTNDTTGTTTANSAASTTSTTASASGTGTASAVAACQSDVKLVVTALAAYMATTGSNAAPAAAWSAATYPTNFTALTNAPSPGPYMKMPPGDNHYVILFDSSGHVWVEPPGTFIPTYDAANDANNVSVCARVAR